jgi:hypothetical protein
MGLLVTNFLYVHYVKEPSSREAMLRAKTQGSIKKLTQQRLVVSASDTAAASTSASAYRAELHQKDEEIALLKEKRKKLENFHEAMKNLKEQFLTGVAGQWL